MKRILGTVALLPMLCFLGCQADMPVRGEDGKYLTSETGGYVMERRPLTTEEILDATGNFAGAIPAPWGALAYAGGLVLAGTTGLVYGRKKGAASNGE